MNLKIEHDVNENPYIVVNVNLTDIDCKGTKFTTLLSNFIFHNDNSGEMFHNLTVRNNSKFHITLLNVPETNKFDFVEHKLDDTIKLSTTKDTKLDNFVNFDTHIINPDILDDIEFKGIGSISKNDLSTFFIVVNSQKLDAMREILGSKRKSY